MASTASARSKTVERPTGWREVERWASLALASAAISFGMRRRNLAGVCLAVAATPLAYRGLFGAWPHITNGSSRRDDTRVALAGRRGIQVRASIRLEKPVDEVFRFWRRFENRPRFMANLERVSDLGNGRSHWVAKGPGGVGVEWDAEIINEIDNRLIAWRSLPGSDVVSAGSVYFSSARGGRECQVAVNMQYEPPAGRAGALVATIAGREPSQTIREDLRRFRELLETGEVARPDGASSGGFVR